MWRKLLLLFSVAVLWPIRLSTCQKELGDIELGCPQGSYRLADYCYVIFQTFVSFDEAEIICETGSGTLAPIKDEETFQFLQKLRVRKFLHHYWFGLSDKKTEGEWVFTDGTRLSGFSRWHRGEPNNYNKVQHCVNMVPSNHLEWDDEDCARKLLYVCQFDRVNCSDTQPRYGPSCYDLSEDLATYDEAEFSCETRGGHLANIKTEGTFNFLKTIIYADKFWLNMTEKHMMTILRDRASKLSWVTDTWVGTRFLDGVWMHSDGSVVNLTWWAQGEPHAASNGEDCVKLGQLWSDVQCDLRHSFICRYEVAAVSKVTVTSVPCVLGDTESRMSSSAVKSPPSNSKGVTIDVAQFSMVLLGCAVLGVLLAGLLFMGIYLHRRRTNIGQERNNDQDMEILRESDEEHA